MSLKKYIDRVRRIDYMIRTKSTGDIRCLAKKIELSRSTTIDFLKEMKELGFPIKYCRKRHIYFYDEDGKMIEKLFDKELNKEEMKKTVLHCRKFVRHQR